MTIATEPPAVLNYHDPRRLLMLDFIGAYQSRFDARASHDEVLIDMVADLTHLYMEWVSEFIAANDDGVTAEVVHAELDDFLSSVALHVTEESPLLVEF